MTLVLIPGFMLDADLWRDVVPGLQCLAPIFHADTSRDSTLTDMASRALASVPGRFAVTGFSMGGYVAREMVRLAPGRVSSLVLIATSARADSEVQAQRKAAAVAHIAVAGFGGLSRSAIVPSLHPAHAGDGEMIGRIQAMSARLGGDVFCRQSALDRHEDGAGLAAIACPTLIIAARPDRLRSVAEAEELHAGIAGSELVIVENAGHMIPMETPDELVGIVAPWLAEAANRYSGPCSS